MLKRLELFIFSLSLLSFCLICDKAHAFCGVYATSSSAAAKNNSSEVALMRHGTRTVLSMRNNYKGPAEDFAIVIPVPEILEKADVHTLPHEVFDKLDRFTAPRLVEYWERDPCSSGYGKGTKTLVRMRSEMSATHGRTTVVKASFVVGEYTIQILSAEESTELEKWLTDHGYKLPKGASKVLASYIAQGMYFLVAKVDPKKVKFDKSGEALLSPLQFAYTSNEFSLPVRLGLLNASGPQDLIVYILSQEHTPFISSNYKSAFYPTNLVVGEEEAKHYDAFNEALFEDFQRKHPKTLAIEHFWWSKGCDPCPVDSLNSGDMSTLGLKKALEPDLSLDTPSLEFTYPGIREEGHADLARHIHDAQTRDHLQVLDCYDKHRPRGGHTAYLHVSLEIAPDGQVKRVEMSEKSFQDVETRKCIEKQLETWTVPASTTKKRSLVEFGLGFYTPHPRRPSYEGRWHVTRLHGRYTSEEISEDIRFEPSDFHVEAGSGPPSGPDATLSPFKRKSYARFFQTRHVLLHNWEEPLTCKYPNRGKWGLSTEMTSKKKTIAVASKTSTGKFKLTKDIQKQLADFYKQQEKERARTE